MKREDILNKAKECVCGSREQDYGSPEDNFQRIAKLWSDYLEYGVSPVDVAMLMSLLKIVRIKNGGGSGDSFVDLAGYAACGGEIAGMEPVQDDLWKAHRYGFQPKKQEERMLAYISGPITGTDDWQERFAKAEEELSEFYDVINPARVSASLPPMEHCDYMAVDLALLDLCDVIVMLPGWEKSKGASKEYAYAKEEGIKIRFYELMFYEN